jgi:3-oxoacyl-[acyl-carrier protein] reductase
MTMGMHDGRVAAVTGGAGGIGRAVAARLAADGAAIAVLDLDGAAAGAAATELAHAGFKAAGIAIDVGDDSSVEGAFRKTAEQLSDPDILVNVAAIAGQGVPVEDMSLPEWDEMFRVNTRSVFLCTRAVIPAMRRKKWGRIVNFASEVAHRGNPGLAHYAASKAAVIGFTKCLAHEVVADGIRANVIAPGPTDTPMLAGIDDALLVKIKQLMPVGRLGTPEEIAAATAYLASNEADFCVGTTLNVNGGAFMA